MIKYYVNHFHLIFSYSFKKLSYSREFETGFWYNHLE